MKITPWLLAVAAVLMGLGCPAGPAPRRPVARAADGACTAADGRHCLDPPKRKALRQRCSAGSAASCEALARHFTGRAGRRNAVRAVALFRLACALGSDRACFVCVARRKDAAGTGEAKYARHVLLVGEAPGGAKRAEIDKELLFCLGGDGAQCAAAAAHCGGSRLGRRLARLGCAQAHAASCRDLLGKHGDPFAERLGRRGLAATCAKGASRVCHLLAKRLAAGTGGLPKQPKRAHILQLRACKGGIEDACYALAIAYGYGNDAVEVDTKQYLKYLILACKMRSSEACRELRTPNAQLQKACREQGLAAACALLKTRR